MSGILCPGQIINENYELIAPVGEGGMGAVYKARQLNMDRIVALKFLSSSHIMDKDSRARFLREGRMLSQLTHPHIPAFYEFGMWNAQYPYIAMEFLEGKSLRSILTEVNKLSWTRCFHIVTQVCDAMFVAHQHGIIHRDLKPNNLMLLNQPSPDFVKIVDFGLARLASQQNTNTITETGLLIGSIYYMSPEQCLGRRADSRADIYALGCIMYEALTGRPPFEADTPIAMMHQHVNTLPPLPSSLVNDQTMPQAVDFVIERAMAKNPSDRYQTMQEFADDLKLVSAGQGKICGAATHRRLRAARKRNPVPKIALITGATVAIAGLALLSDEGVSLVTSMRSTGTMRYDDLLTRGRELASQGRTGAAIKVFDVVAQQAPKAAQKATALVEQSVLLERTGLRAEAVSTGRRAIVALARASKRMEREDEESDRALLADMMSAQLKTMSALGQATNFDCSNARYDEVSASLSWLKNYFLQQNDYMSVLLLEKSQFGDINPGGYPEATYYANVALAALRAGQKEEALKACDALMAKAARLPQTSMDLGLQRIELAAALIESTSAGASSAGLDKSYATRAAKLLAQVEPLFRYDIMGSARQLSPALYLECHRSVAETYKALAMQDMARKHLHSAVAANLQRDFGWLGIICLGRIYTALATIESESDNTAEALTVITKGIKEISFFSEPNSATAATAGVDVCAAVDIARSQIYCCLGDIQCRQNQLQRAEGSYREATAVMINLGCFLDDASKNRHLTSATKAGIVEEQKIVDTSIVEVARRMHSCLQKQHRFNEAIAYLRQSIGNCRDIGRYNASGSMYPFLVEAMILSGRYSDLDAILRECQTPVAAGTGLYEPKVRFEILLTAARSYSRINEHEKTISGMIEARERIHKLGEAEQKIRYDLLLGNSLLATHNSDGALLLKQAEEIARRECPLALRSCLMSLGIADFHLHDFAAANLKLTRASKLPADRDLDLAIEEAYRRASQKDYAAAIAQLKDTTTRGDTTRQEVAAFQRLQACADIAQTLDRPGDAKRYASEAFAKLRDLLGKDHPAVLRAQP